jgi:uncharacterized protein YjbI with pentapeptide repeats
MDFRTFAGMRVKRPIIEIEDLSPSNLSLTGRFNHDESLGEDLDQADAQGYGLLRQVVVRRSSLAESRFTELELMNVAFRNVIMPNTSWEHVTARRVELIDCQAVGLQLGLAKAEDLYFEGCRLDYARLDVEQHRGAIVFHRCTFKEATLSGDLSGVVFSDCELGMAEFQARRAANCDLTSSRLPGASGLLTLVGAKITEEQASALSIQLASEVGFVVTA